MPSITICVVFLFWAYQNIDFLNILFVISHENPIQNYFGNCSVDFQDYLRILVLLKQTRWTFFRVKLVFECDFEICWSLGPWDLGTPGPWESWTSSLLQHLLIIPLTSSYLILSLPPNLLLKYGVVMGGWGCEL